MSTTNQYVDPNDEMLKNVTQTSSDIQDDYTEDMKDVIALNEGAKAEALGSLGVDKNGNVIEGSATEKLINSQNEQTDFAISEIERQKQQAKEDYQKEQRAAYTDWQIQSGKYGVNAEKMAAQGLENSGYSETSQVMMYNQYQARITAARESFVKVQADYDAAIANARVQNNAVLAQIAVDAMKQRTELIVQFALNGVNLLTTMAEGKASLRQQGLSNYMSVYNQLASLEESRRQHEVDTQYKYDNLEWQKQLAEQESGYVDNGNGVDLDNKTDTSTGVGDTTTSQYKKLMKQEYIAEASQKWYGTRNSAVKYLKGLGIDVEELDTPFLTFKQWSEGKKDVDQNTVATSQNAIFKLASYELYLRQYVLWAINEM